MGSPFSVFPCDLFTEKYELFSYSLEFAGVGHLMSFSVLCVLCKLPSYVGRSRDLSRFTVDILFLFVRTLPGVVGCLLGEGANAFCMSVCGHLVGDQYTVTLGLQMSGILFLHSFYLLVENTSIWETSPPSTIWFP
jgi:hypothetical protein